MKTIRRIIAIILILLTIMTSPLSVYFGIENNVYATTTFTQDLESQIFLQTLIPTLIAAGLVFKTDYDWDVNNGSQLHQHIVTQSLKEYFENLGSNYKPPNEPDGPNLGEVIKEMLKGITLVSAGYGIGKNIIEIPQMFWKLVKSFVDDNYDEGQSVVLPDGLSITSVGINGTEISVSSPYYYRFYDENLNHTGSIYLNTSNNLISIYNLGYGTTNNFSVPRYLVYKIK